MFIDQGPRKDLLLIWLQVEDVFTRQVYIIPEEIPVISIIVRQKKNFLITRFL